MFKDAESGVTWTLGPLWLKSSTASCPRGTTLSDMDMDIGVILAGLKFCNQSVLRMKSMGIFQWTFVHKRHLPVVGTVGLCLSDQESCL